MTDATNRVEFLDVEATDEDGLSALTCRVGGQIVTVPPLRILPGSEVSRKGDRGRLVLPRDVARQLGLV
jgi:hypothetical protein